MLPIIPALVLAFISFLASAFVILRIIIPILPPHPLSRRVSPAEFGLPKFRSLSPADKGHLWLACLDLLALIIFIWQAVNESAGGPSGFETASDPASSVRLWFVMTVRQTCLCIIASITLLHVRMGRSVSFGRKHWMLWSPTFVLVVASTAIAGVASGAGAGTLFVGIVAYSSTISVITTVAFGCLMGTLFIIKRNLSVINEESDPWPPVREIEEKPRPSFATEEIDAIRDGASWITSTASASSHRNSVSAWSFSTHHTTVASSHHGHNTGRPQSNSHPSVPAKSSFWFGSTTPNDIQVPPVPPLPSPYGPLSPTAESLSDPDPFRRDVPSPASNYPRVRLESQTSWLTSSNGSHTTVSAWSYPTSHHEGSVRNISSPDLNTPLTAVNSRPVTPNMANAQVLGGYGFATGGLEAEKGLSALATPTDATIEVSIYHAIGWLILIWVPVALAIPYLIVALQHTAAPTAFHVLFVLSITLSSPCLALNILFGYSLPIPTGLFDTRDKIPANLGRAPSPTDNLPPYKWSHEYKRSMSASVTVVEGRRSGDVWLAKGDAMEGKSKISRAMSMLNPVPKLSVLPPEEDCEQPQLTPPLPMQNEDSSLPITIINGTPQSENSAQFGRLRQESMASSRYSGGDESLAVASRIMIAQRHYSALAQTVVVSGTSPDKVQPAGADLFVASTTSVAVKKHGGQTHLRSRSASSFSGPETPTGNSFNISPPPSFPLPPTPPNVRAARLAQLKHKKSFSSGFSFGPVDDMNEIDALTAGVLPLLVPGLKVGSDMKIVGHKSSASTFTKSNGIKSGKKMSEFGADFSSPEVHSTPAKRPGQMLRGTTAPGHKKKHFSLPSLGLGKEGMHSLATWSADIHGALEHRVGQYAAVPSNVDLGWRNTVFGADSIPNAIPQLQAIQEEAQRPRSTATSALGRTMSTRSLGLRADVPHAVDDARASLYSNNMIPPTSAASTVTLFEDFEAGLQSGPQAESTPHNTYSQRPSRTTPAPPMPPIITSENRRSSIVYIKSDDHVTNITNYAPTEAPASAMSAFAQWSSRAVRPLMPKASKLQRKMPNVTPSESFTKPASPREGLRPLALLQERNTNIDAANTSPAIGGTRPLTLGKRQKSRKTVPDNDENTNPDPSSSSNKNLKPLKLARSETSKMRGILRKSEVLPDVVIRPPSTSENMGYAYSFHD